MNASPLKIAMLAPPWLEIPLVGYGGVETMCGNLIDGLLRRGHDVTLIGVGKRRTAAKFHATVQENQFSKIGTTRPEIIHSAAAHHFLTSENFDIIHDHNLSGPLFAPLRKATTFVTTRQNSGTRRTVLGPRRIYKFGGYCSLAT